MDRYFQGAPGYQMPNRNVCAPDWESSRETAAYLVISAWYDIRTVGGMDQLHKWLEPLECLANHIEAQFGPDGLVYYQGHRTMWFDTYKLTCSFGMGGMPDNLTAKFQAYMDFEDERLTKNLEEFKYDIDELDTVYIILGPGRLEKVWFGFPAAKLR